MYELFTLGGGTYLVDLLNAVAAITSGGAYITLAQLAGVAGLAWVLFRTAFGGSWKDNAKWILLFVVVWGAMIVPKATVRVVDRLDPTLAPAVVANVPIGLALFASLTSQVGDGLTRLTEQAFTLPNDLAYRRHGLIFGARLAAKATRLEITDAVFARNVRNYARQCVFHALLLGHISADDLRESTDIWALVTATGSPSAGASPARMFEFATRQAATGTGATPIDRQIVTCRDGAARLDGQWNAEIARAGTVFGRRIFLDARTEALARAELLAALPAAHDFLIGASRSAGEIMRQQMVLNAVHDAGEQWAAEAGNAAALRAYTEARAEAQTVSAYRAIGRQAETWVPLLRIVFECLYVGAFPMAVLLMLTPAGLPIFRSYVTGLVWLQSWGPLCAVLHRISMGEAADRTVGVQGYAGTGKTTMLRRARALMEKKGYEVRGLAPSASAARTLEGEAGIGSETLRRFLARYAGVAEGRMTRKGEKEMRAAFRKTTLVVDEGSLASTVQARNLLRIADALRIPRVVLVGDAKQLDAVDAGKPFAQLQKAGMKTAVMDEIMRQSDPALKEAVEASLAGDVARAFEKLGENVAEVKPDNLAGAAAARWLVLSPEERAKAGLMAPSHGLRERINEIVRERLVRDGAVHGPAMSVERLVSRGYTNAEKTLAANYMAGDTVAFHRPYKRLGVDKGDELRVAGVHHGTRTVNLEGADGRSVAWEPSRVAARAGGVEVYRSEEIELRAGDRIRWTRNDAGLGLVNSQTAEVAAVRDGKVTFCLEDGRMLDLASGDPQLRHVDRAWASTVHAFQGRTVDTVIAAMEANHPRGGYCCMP